MKGTLKKNTYIQVITEALKQIPSKAGIYKMISSDGKILYIGKAKNLPKRISNYLAFDKLSLRIKMMVNQIKHIEFVTTNTEVEALLLEASLIHKNKPKYNVLLKDDKSFPYITIDNSLTYGKISKYRGEKQDNVSYFGPFAKSSNVDETIELLQKLFLLRNCSDHYFKSRKRACIQYQLKRCSAPCVGKIPQAKYQEAINQAVDFLSGKSNIVQKQLVTLMNQASDKFDYEAAAIYRDRIKALDYIQSKQVFNNLKINNADIIASYSEMGECCVEVFFFRNGQTYGNKAFFLSDNDEEDMVISSFISQFYQNHPVPDQIILEKNLADTKLMQDGLSVLAGKKIKITIAKNQEHKSIVELAVENAKQEIKRKVNSKVKNQENLIQIKNLLELAKIPKRIEIYDNSHMMGDNALGAMVVATEDGFEKSSYRKFNMKNHNGDDYAMMRTMLERRFTRLKNEHPEYVEKIWPDLLIIDGGMNQLSISAVILKKLSMDINIIAIAKGENRNAGGETLYRLDQEPINPSNDLNVMNYIQRLRDEAHRYAITSHRKMRDKSLSSSVLDMIPQIGKQRKLSLLKYFGSIQAIREASIEDLTKCDLISKETANSIFNYFKNSG
jgi:excinuclease ABC subunit C